VKLTSKPVLTLERYKEITRELFEMRNALVRLEAELRNTYAPGTKICNQVRKATTDVITLRSLINDAIKPAPRS
jgi:hypothetical protein